MTLWQNKNNLYINLKASLASISCSERKVQLNSIITVSRHMIFLNYGTNVSFCHDTKNLNWLHRLWVSLLSTLHMAVAITDPAMAYTSAWNDCTSFNHRSLLGKFSPRSLGSNIFFLFFWKSWTLLAFNQFCEPSFLAPLLHSMSLVHSNHVTQCRRTNLKSALQQPSLVTKGSVVQNYLDKHLTFWTFTLTLTLNTAIQHFHWKLLVYTDLPSN